MAVASSHSSGTISPLLIAGDFNATLDHMASLAAGLQELAQWQRDHSATDGESALEIYRKERGRIDLVVLDLIMPGMGGRKLLRELYRMDPGAKVVIASGCPEDASTEEARGERSECLRISKPYETKQLLTAIRRVLDA